MNQQQTCHHRANHTSLEVPEIFRVCDENSSSSPSISRSASNSPPSLKPSSNLSSPSIISRNGSFPSPLWQLSTKKRSCTPQISNECALHVESLNFNGSPKKNAAIPIVKQSCNFKHSLPKRIIASIGILYVTLTYIIVINQKNLGLISSTATIKIKDQDKSDVIVQKQTFHPRVTHVQFHENHRGIEPLQLISFATKNYTNDGYGAETEYEFPGNDYVANSDDSISNPSARRWDENDDCVLKASWQNMFYPTCNTMHEFHLLPNSSRNKQTSNTKTLLSNGAWRMTWELNGLSYDSHINTESDHKTSLDYHQYALKMLKFQRDFNALSFEANQIDSIAMERLTSSPHVINEYSFCGNSVVTEFAHGRTNDLVQKKSLTAKDRLYLVNDLLKGLADVHGIDYPTGDNSTLVHSDINSGNIGMFTIFVHILYLIFTLFTN